MLTIVSEMGRLLVTMRSPTAGSDVIRFEGPTTALGEVLAYGRTPCRIFLGESGELAWILEDDVSLIG